MSALQDFANAFVYLDGLLLTTSSQVTVEKKSGLNMVETTVLGLAGAVRGSSRVEISVENAIPSADFEVNPDPFMETGRIVEIKIVMGSRVSIHNGYLTDATYSHSVNDASKVNVKFTGKFGNFE